MQIIKVVVSSEESSAERDRQTREAILAAEGAGDLSDYGDEQFFGREYAWRDGCLYERWREDEFFLLRRPMLSPIQGIREDGSFVPEVLCPCGSVTFTLWYGNYEIKARCTECGEMKEVYSG